MTHYIRYFIASIRNRGWLFTLQLLWNEWRYEQRYGINTLRISTIEGLHNEHHHHYQGASYYIMHQLLRQLPQPPHPHTRFVDLGAGKGRSLIVAAAMGYQHVVGVELSDELCRIAQQNIEQTQHRYPHTQFELLHTDALHYQISPHTQVIFLFNPFNYTIMQPLAHRIKAAAQQHQQKIYVAYINPIYASAWTDAGFEIQYSLRSKKYTEAILLTN